MSYEKFLEIVLATVKVAYGEQFDNLNEKEKEAVIMRFASDIFAGHKDILDAVARSVHVEMFS